MNPGDFVIVAGYPGRTFRYRTAAEVKNMQEYTYPDDRSATRRTSTTSFARWGRTTSDVEIANANRVKGNDNTLKNYTGTLTGFEKFGIVGAAAEARGRR